MSFLPNTAQQKAFKKVQLAIENAKKAGLVFYAKSEKLVAYTKQADSYIEKDFLSCFESDASQIECISASGLINDSGADDYPRYRSLSDQEEYQDCDCDDYENGFVSNTCVIHNGNPVIYGEDYG